MKVRVYGLGVWGPGFSGWPALQDLLCTPAAESPAAEAPAQTEASAATVPKPGRIPPNERRRAPLPVKLAIEVASQACEVSGFEPDQLICVFGSGLGDTEITDSMCRTLATPEKLISPTRFHNSVHNAAAGYWSIVSGCRAASSSVSGFEYTFTVTLLESVVQCSADQQPVLFAVYDTPAPAPLDYPLYNHAGFAAALVMAPLSSEDTPRPRAGLFDLELQLQPGAADWPALQTGRFSELYRSNPAARALALLEQLALNDDHRQPLNLNLALPINAQSALNISITPKESVRP